LLVLFLASDFLGLLPTVRTFSTNFSAGRLLDGLYVATPSLDLLLVVILCSPSTSVTPFVGLSSGTCGDPCSDYSSGPYGDPCGDSCDGSSVDS